MSRRQESDSFVRASNVIGRDDDKDYLVGVLLSSNFDDNQPSVLSIVGLGGLGKTTLAKIIYNDARIVENFQERIWVNNHIDLKKIFEIITVSAFPRLNMNRVNSDEMIDRVQSHFSSKRFLIVLDDVCDINARKWTEMIDILNCGARGSSVLVTTRSRKIAMAISTFPAYCLKKLSNDECLSIFLKFAFKDGQGKGFLYLVEIGKMIIKKCIGNPLAVETLGSLLSTTRDINQWIYMRDEDMWKIDQRENDIIPVLRSSYDEFSTHLKQCFALCSIYPKGDVIQKDSLINRWIAHGLIQPSSCSGRELEEIGNSYIKELIAISFFEDVHEVFGDEAWEFKIHPIVHDLARSLVVEEMSILYSRTEIVTGKSGHILISKQNPAEKEFVKIMSKVNQTLPFSLEFKVGCLNEASLDRLIKSSQFLRILDLNGEIFRALPKSIGTLKHLEFLSLFGNCCIKILPDTICDLRNLRSLNLYGCEKLQMLPKNFGRLIKLRWLTLTSTMTCLPEKGLKGLASLRSLFINDCYFLKSLSNGVQHLVTLRVLHIYKCHSLTSLSESMKYLTSLETLRILDCEKLNMKEGRCMEGLRNLNNLAVKGLPSLRELPLGLEDSSASLRYVHISDCHALERLPNWLETRNSLLKLFIINCSRLKSR